MGRKTVKLVCDVGQGRPGIGNPDDGYARNGLLWFFHNYGLSTPVNGLLDKIMAITICSLYGHEKTFFRGLAAVVGKSAHLTLQVPVHLESGKILNQVFQQQYFPLVCRQYEAAGANRAEISARFRVLSHHPTAAVNIQRTSEVLQSIKGSSQAEACKIRHNR